MKLTSLIRNGLQLSIVFAAIGPLTACTPILAASVGTGSYPSNVPTKNTKKRASASRAQVVPPSHQPPPGLCRIWFPERSPGQPPPPGNCDELRQHVPPGASLIYG